MRGAILALISAVLFGISTPLAKLLLDQINPWLLAGLLYLGAGIGLATLILVRRILSGPPEEASLDRTGWLWLGGAIASGGVVAPVLLMFGLTRSPASTVSLLLNLEVVLTALLAWMVFGEHVSRRIALGMLAIACGAVVLSWSGGLQAGDIAGPLAIVGACLAWALDNNLTRKVSLSDPLTIAMAKGLAAGSINIVIAGAAGSPWPSPEGLAAAGAVGFLGYGVSLALFVQALRLIGAARTGAYYATAPFVGSVVGILLLGDPVTIQLGAAGLLIGWGVWLHLTELHEHDHEHEPMMHEHRHVHDEHHQHVHPEPMGAEPHSHRHRHAAMRHRHAHFPDPHHLHPHP